MPSLEPYPMRIMVSDLSRALFEAWEDVTQSQQHTPRFDWVACDPAFRERWIVVAERAIEFMAETRHVRRKNHGK